MNKKEIKFLIYIFISWRIALFVFLLFAISAVTLQKDFLGGGLGNYLKNPYLWAWANFDGEHYLSIARIGYLPLQHFYFPAYPLITRFIVTLFNQSFKTFAISGLLVSNISFLIALFGFWKLIRLDYKENIARMSIILLLVFPTSFYFGSFYTESLFFALVVWSFYFARRKRWLWAGILGGLATATRVVGVALIPAFLAEFWLQRKRQKSLYPLVGVLLVPMGMIIYMLFLRETAGDPLEFVKTVSIFGQQRSTTLVLLPQVFYRYIFRILPNINYDYFPVVFTTLLEFSVALLFLALSVIAFFKLRLSYAFYLAAGYIIPTLSGSFSSLPRYVLVLFPAYILLALWLSKKSRLIQATILIILFLTLAVSTALFLRGYWVA